jgi:hypothetical protein
MPRTGGRTKAASDIGIVGAAAVVFVSGFLPWYGASFGGYSATASGWNSGFLAWCPVLLCVAAAVTVALPRFGNVRLPNLGQVGPALWPIVGGGLAVLLILIRWVTLPDFSDSVFATQIHSGAEVGLYLGLLGALAVTGFGVLGARTADSTIFGRR